MYAPPSATDEGRAGNPSDSPNTQDRTSPAVPAVVDAIPSRPQPRTQTFNVSSDRSSRPGTPQIFSSPRGRRRSFSFSEALPPSAFAAALSQQNSADDCVADADPVQYPPSHLTDQRRLSNAALQSRVARENQHTNMYYGSPWSQPPVPAPTSTLVQMSKGGVVWIDGKRNRTPRDVWQKFKPERASAWCMPDEDGGSRACMCRLMACCILAVCILAFLLTGVLILACYIWQTKLPITSIALSGNATQIVQESVDSLTLVGTLRLSVENLNAWPAEVSVRAHYGDVGKSDVKQVRVPPKGGMVDAYLPVQLTYTRKNDPGWTFLRQMLGVCGRLGNATSTAYMRWRITLTMRLFQRAIRFSTSKLRLVPVACLLPDKAENTFLRTALAEMKPR